MYPDDMYRNNFENNENFGTFYGMNNNCHHDQYLEDTSTIKEEDEISRSLKMFAMLTAYKTEPTTSDYQVDAIMQEFACNGFSCDELRYQRCNNELTNYSEGVRNNLWKPKPSHIAEYNRKHSKKRYNNNMKSGRYSPVRHCVFCENNNQPHAVVKSHNVRDIHDKVLCPKLRTYVCPICKATGDNAHTVKYCPQKPIITMEDAIKAESFRLAKSSYFKHQMKA